MGSRLKLSGQSLLLLLLFITTLPAQDETEIRTLYQKAKLRCVAQEWGDAIDLFKVLLKKYPQSKYEDDAYFWIAYCLEKEPDQKPQAFDAFSHLISEFPQSPYVDDAIGFQIDLAENLVLSGKDKYRSFLYNQLKQEMSDMQYRAAIALGRIGDPTALPILEKMVNNEDYGKLARDLTTLLQINRMSVNTPKQAEEDARFRENRVGIEENTGSSFLWFGSKRYEQYRSMLKKAGGWTENELTDFALWHIVTTDAFETYRTLPTENEKKEWLRKYWKRNDPTPTSPENEREEEFRRRVKYARENFSDLWEPSEFKYMPDQFLRPDWPHAPWDARGELYIKYGAPDARSSQGWHTEMWTYYRYGVDFLVSAYMTNIYGKAIYAGEMSTRRYNLYGRTENAFDEMNPVSSSTQYFFGRWNSLDSFMQANFIFKNEMRYEHDYKAHPIKQLQLSLKKQTSAERDNIVYQYTIPAGEFKMLEQKDAYRIKFREVFCVLDEELREVARHDIVRNVDNIPDKKYMLSENISFHLPAGKYTFYLRLEDQNEKNLGVFSQHFEVSEN